jgi:hypothetical protein
VPGSTETVNPEAFKVRDFLRLILPGLLMRLPLQNHYAGAHNFSRLDSYIHVIFLHYSATLEYVPEIARIEDCSAWGMSERFDSGGISRHKVRNWRQQASN